MEYGKSKSAVIQSALIERVVSKNIGEKLDIEDIIYLNRIKNIMNCYSIESVLQNYISAVDIDEEYKAVLEAKSQEENLKKNRIMDILRDALEEIPENIAAFISTFLANALCNEFEHLEKICEELKANPVYMNYVKKYEEKLGFADVVTKINTLQYIKKKYSTFADYYYIDLIQGYTNSALIAILYILYE